MSCFLSSADCLNALATYWERKSNQPSHYRTAEQQINRAVMLSVRAMCAPLFDPTAQTAATAATTERLLKTMGGNALKCVFGILLDENKTSIEARYSDADDMTETGPEYVGRSIPVVDYWIQNSETGNIVSLLDGYCYQACESDLWESSVAFMICEQIRAYLLEDLSQRDCGAETHWAEFTAPEDPRAVRMREALAA
jgi:hypothetical protein